MIEKLLNKLRLEVDAEIERVGFIEDSFIDEISLKLAKNEILKSNDDIDFNYEKEIEIEELSLDLMDRSLEVIKYSYFYEIENGNAKMFYYKANRNFDNLKELKEYFRILKILSLGMGISANDILDISLDLLLFINTAADSGDDDFITVSYLNRYVNDKVEKIKNLGDLVD